MVLAGGKGWFYFVQGRLKGGFPVFLSRCGEEGCQGPSGSLPSSAGVRAARLQGRPARGGLSAADSALPSSRLLPTSVPWMDEPGDK